MTEQIQMYKMTSKDIEIAIPARNRKEAFAKFSLRNAQYYLKEYHELAYNLFKTIISKGLRADSK